MLTLKIFGNQSQIATDMIKMAELNNRLSLDLTTIDAGLDQIRAERLDALKRGDITRLIELGHAEKHLMTEKIDLLTKREAA